MNKEYKNIDDLFRDKFENFEVDPPDHVWENIKPHIQDKGGNGSGGGFKNGGIAGLSALLISIGIISIYLINNSFSYQTQNSEADDVQVAAISQNLIAENNTQSKVESAIIPENQKQEQRVEEEKDKRRKDSKGKKGKNKSNSQKANSKENKNSSFVIDPILSSDIEKSKQAKNEITASPIRVNEIKQSYTNPPLVQEVTYFSEFETGFAENLSNSVVSNSEIETSIVRGQQSNDDMSNSNEGVKSDYGKPNSWQFGLYFTPEMIVYPSDNKLKNYSYSLDLNVSYKFKNYFFQSGLGLSRVHDKGDNIIDYNKYLGSYEDVYNVTFDSTENGVVPIYHTETVNVYDTINHTTVTTSKRYFTYLQIPVFFGYYEESKRFGWFVKGGPSVSLLMKKEVPESSISAEEAKITNIESELPGRIDANLQLVLSAGVTYKLGQKVSLSVEPMFRYYFKSAYEADKLNTKHPYSVGLRTGLLLNF